MPTGLSVTLAVGAQQLAKHKAIVTRITAIEELAGVTILCSDKTGTPTTNKLTIDRNTIRAYGPFSTENVILLAAFASRVEKHDASDLSVVQAMGDPALARKGIQLLNFKPFNPVDKRTEFTYREESTKLKRVTKSMAGISVDIHRYVLIPNFLVHRQSLHLITAKEHVVCKSIFLLCRL